MAIRKHDMDTDNQTSNNDRQVNTQPEPVQNQVNQQPVNAIPARNTQSQMRLVPVPARNNNAPPDVSSCWHELISQPMTDDNGKAEPYGIIAVIAIMTGIISGLISGGIVSSANHTDSNANRSMNDNMTNHDYIKCSRY